MIGQQEELFAMVWRRESEKRFDGKSIGKRMIVQTEKWRIFSKATIKSVNLYGKHSIL